MQSKFVPLLISAVLAVLVQTAGGARTIANAATVIAVDCTANAGALSSALASAADGDTFEINGTCVGSFELAHQSTLKGLSGARLDAAGSGRVLLVDPGVTADVNDLVLSGGFAPDAGGIWVSTGANVTLNRSTVTGNSVGVNGSGGGIANFGTLTINDSTVSGNHAGNNGAGAGILNTAARPLTINRSTITGNSGGFAGAGIHNSGMLTVVGSRIVNNSTTFGGASNGGGIYNQGFSALIVDTTISSNFVNNGGGGIYNVGPLTLRNSTVSGNSGRFGSGGGINHISADTLTVENSTIADNVSESGGGLGTSGGPAVVRYSTIANNTATAFNSGNSIFTLFFGSVRLESSIVAAASLAPSCVVIIPLGSGGIFDGGYNLDSGASCGLSATNHSLTNADPAFASAGLTNNGGQTATIALSGGSPAIDSIPVGTSGCGTTVSTDQRGVVRPQQVGCDIGAFERDVQDDTPPTITATRTPPPNFTGWNNTTVALSWAVSDPESGIASSTGCGAVTVTDETAGTLFTCSATNGVGLASSLSVTIRIDRTAPTILFAGNLGAYTVEQTVLITCSAVDDLSGVASTSCPTVASGPATDFVGSSASTTATVGATVSDVAGNVTNASTTFTVTVTANGICALASQSGLTDALCAHVKAIAGAPNPSAKAGALGAFDSFLVAQTGKTITVETATLLSRLAHLL